MATLRRKDLSAKVAGKLGGSYSHGESALKAVLESIRGALVAGDRVVLTDFGAFEARQVKERQILGIQGREAGQRITVSAHERVGFVAGAGLTSSVQGR